MKHRLLKILLFIIFPFFTSCPLLLLPSLNRDSTGIPSRLLFIITNQSQKELVIESITDIKLEVDLPLIVKNEEREFIFVPSNEIKNVLDKNIEMKLSIYNMYYQVTDFLRDTDYPELFI